jgi:hypothetical protein
MEYRIHGALAALDLGVRPRRGRPPFIARPRQATEIAVDAISALFIVRGLSVGTN